ncbi:MAG TPA: UDP-3-O-(3-hydroxymyristoyl)glucosamine N-acyltransferase [Desulfonatronum sp.]|nr:UDP-3-O-(3-hydroxymyristoyl)glucosamine N-acyltransferase [Desulfonatronum sp.]
MARTLHELAETLDLPVQGPDLEIKGVASLELAGEHDLSFLSSPKHASLLAATKAGAVILARDHADQIPRALISDNPSLDFARALRLFEKEQGCLSGHSEQAFIHPQAQVHPSAIIYPFAFIGPRAVVCENCRLFCGVYVGEDCRVGAHSTLYPNVVLMARTILGSNVIIHPGTVLGGDGFGYTPSPHGLEKVPQVGHLVIEDHVEIGANCAIDRAALGVTRIGRGTKVDNLVQIGHNVAVGADCILVSQVGIAGSSKLGDRVTLAGQVGIADHLHLGDDCRVGAKSGVNRSLEGCKDYLGSPAVEARKFMRIAASWNRLPDLVKRVATLEKELKALKTTKSEDSHEQN